MTLPEMAVMIPREVEKPLMTPREFLDSFHGVSIEPEWEEDTISAERQESLANLINVLDYAIAGPVDIVKPEVKRYRLRDTYKTRSRVTLLRIAAPLDSANEDAILSGSEIVMRYNTGLFFMDKALLKIGRAAYSDTTSRMWQVPAEPGRLLTINTPVRQLRELPGTSQPFYEASIAEKIAPRADIEKALNRVGVYFQSSRQEKRRQHEARMRRLKGIGQSVLYSFGFLYRTN